MSDATNTKNWSEQQKAIFEFLANGKGNFIVRARAGTGKTSTILEGINYANETRILLVAFNKKIAEELVARLQNPYATAKTLHSLGFSLVLRNWKGTRVDKARGMNLARKAAGSSTPDPVVGLIARIASKGKNMLPTTVGQLTDIACEFDLIPEDHQEAAGWTLTRVVACAWAAMKAAAEQRDGTIDFDDMVYVPVTNNWVRPSFDLVLVDEGQDMNAAGLKLAVGSCTKDGRIGVVGDDRQAIYAFRGADSGCLDRLKTELKATELGLTTTYRCPSSIVEYAKTLVPDYCAAPTAPVGTISTLDYSKLAEKALPGDFVLSRKNAPLARTCLSMLRLNKRAKVEGKDIGRGLTSIVKKLGGSTVTAMLSRLADWETKAMTRIVAKTPESREAKAGEIADQAETIRVLADGMATPGEVLARIESLFGDDVAAGGFITCSSVHRAKGRETDTVYVLQETLYPGGRRSIEEQNIEYVSITRCRSNLIWVTGLNAE